MGKKSKAEKKGKNGKKKDEILIEPHDLPAILVQAARSMRTVLSAICSKVVSTPDRTA